MDALTASRLGQNLSDPQNVSATNTSVVALPGDLHSRMDKVIKIALVATLVNTMIALGCTMELSKIKEMSETVHLNVIFCCENHIVTPTLLQNHLLKPKGVLIAIVAQYGFMPLSSFCFAKGFQLRPMETVVVLICGCSPGGNISNLLTLALKGDINLSIVMTTCSIVLAVGMMPLLLFLYCRGFPNLQHAIPFVEISLSLVLLLIPCGIGIFINYHRPQYAKIVAKVGLSISGVAIVVLSIVIVCMLYGRSILTVLSPPLMASAGLMPLLGFMFGYMLSSITRLSQKERRTIAVETGCQNIRISMAILKMAFKTEVMGPLFVFPVIYMVFQLMEAGVLILLFRGHLWLRGKERCGTKTGGTEMGGTERGRTDGGTEEERQTTILT